MVTCTKACLYITCFNSSLQEHYLTPEVHGSIVYDYYLFDLPKILDLCVLYGEGNRPLLSKMIANLFERQPKYVEDWCSTIKSLLLVSTKDVHNVHI